jgi:hypothetical protein
MIAPYLVFSRNSQVSRTSRPCHDHHEQPVLRIEGEADIHAAAQDRRREVADADRPPDEDDQLIQDEREPEGEEQLIVVAGCVRARIPAYSISQSENRHAERRKQQPDPEVPMTPTSGDEEVGAPRRTARRGRSSGC